MGQPNCIPVLLHLQRGAPAAREATVFWTGAITSLLLIGWAAGELLFGWLGDRIGRKRALFVTIVVYAGGTALCALAADIWQLVCFRLVASLGIGGEWAIGATLLAESVPENRRVEAGVIMYSCYCALIAAPGHGLATMPVRRMRRTLAGRHRAGQPVELPDRRSLDGGRAGDVLSRSAIQTSTLHPARTV